MTSRPSASLSSASTVPPSPSRTPAYTSVPSDDNRNSPLPSSNSSPPPLAAQIPPPLSTPESDETRRPSPAQQLGDLSAGPHRTPHTHIATGSDRDFGSPTRQSERGPPPELITSVPGDFSAPNRRESQTAEHLRNLQVSRKRPRSPDCASVPSDEGGGSDRRTFSRQSASPFQTKRVRGTKWPRSEPNVGNEHPLSNVHPRVEMSSLRAIPVETRLAHRYITALHTLDSVYRNRLPCAAYVEKVAHDMVIDSRELRRVHALAVIARLAERKPFEIKRFRFRQILAGHRDQHRITRSLAGSKESRLSGPRRRKGHPMRGESIRDARETLASAGWRYLHRKQRAFDVLNGTETIAQMKEDGVYIDDSEVLSVHEDDNYNDEEAARQKTNSWFSAIRELPDSEGVPDEEINRISRKVEGFAARLRQVPSFAKLKEICTVLPDKRDSEAKVEQVSESSNFDCPSRLAFLIALYRAESLKLQASADYLHDSLHSQRKLRLEFRREVLEKAGISLHLVVEKLLLCSFSSLSQLAEKGNRFVCLGKLISEQDRVRLSEAVRETQIDCLESQMKVRDRRIAVKLVESFLSAKRCLRASIAELRSLLGDEEYANHVVECLHGNPFGIVNILVAEGRPSVFVERAVVDHFGDLSQARAASFANVIGSWTASSGSKCVVEDKFSLTVDEKLAAYCKIHADRTKHDRNTWAEFEASWGLFRVICQRTTIADPVEATIRVLNEDKGGSGILNWLSSESLEKICVRVGTNGDDAVTLRSFANAFVPSICD